ncbi:SMEK domain-containing protein [Pseudomonas sp. 13B_2.1_Bac1]|uniref:SMEK domain-containing protein n=1 Tax=Pseudomonas sp. 13B_2.1_Bac1 TaxID=2971624 RepID=UPI0021C862C2|nr:SMEK domain-containing protein [Pseudomonas sp. 13B_2.1_Bac1]MCU1785537.1 SMEK domain-containing protein [Pseudomonas sp. 13B_2.1_Bac1]
MNDTLDSRNAQLDQLALMLVVFKHYVEMKKNAQLLDTARLAESVIAELMSHLCGMGDFIDLNKDYPNHPGIDLLSDDGTVGVQVTVTRTPRKVKDTLDHVPSLPATLQKLYLVMVCGRQKNYRAASIAQHAHAAGICFDPKTDILDLEGLFEMARHNSQAHIDKAIQRLEKEMGHRALSLLGSFNKNADRVLQVLLAHGVRGPAFNELLDIDPWVAPPRLTTPEALQPWLTPANCATIAEQFNVPPSWLDGADERTGDYYDSSPWRTSGDVMGLLAMIAERYRSAHFHIVIADDIDTPFDCFHDTSPGARDVPLLVFYKAHGPYGDVYAHLGVQPWNVLHHRQAAFFLATAIRDFARQGLGHFSVEWEQWPRNDILASCTGTLLAELVPNRRGRPLDERDWIRFDGRWQFPGRPDLTTAFNDEYLPTVLHGFQRLQQRQHRFRVLQEYVDTQIAWSALAAPTPGAKRVDGYAACDIAQICHVPLRCADALGNEHELSVDQARELIDEQLEMAAADPKKRFVFLDIRVDPARADS